jgi:hypothetical protein
MSAILDELHAIKVKAEAAGDTVADDIKALFHKLTGGAPAIEAEVKADAVKVEHDALAAAETVATDAEHAAAPVVAEAVTAAETVGAEVVADVAKSA